MWLMRRLCLWSSWASFLLFSSSMCRSTLVLIVFSLLSLPMPFPVSRYFCIVIFCSYFVVKFSTCAHCPAGAAHLNVLNLSGTGVESVPDDIAQHLPRLQRLILDKCVKLSFLPVQLGALSGLEFVSVDGCTALFYPPKSVQSNPTRMAAFFKTLHKTSIMWKRLKVSASVSPHPISDAVL